MHEAILRKLRALVRRGNYSITDHAEQELDADELSPFDVEQVVLGGFIVERQRDALSGEWKYVIEGPTTSGHWAVVVAKISVSDKLWVPTVFRL